MKRGEVWLIDLGLAAKARPAIILSVPFQDNEKAVVAYVARSLQRRGGRRISPLSRCHVRHGGFVLWRIEPFDFAQDRLRGTLLVFFR
jgi:mRNA interferase MazF